MIRLLLVDDQTLIVEGLAVMLSLEADFQVVGTADNGQTAIEQVAALEPDVVLMDIRMPVMDGREAARILSQQFPKVKVLVLLNQLQILCSDLNYQQLLYQLYIYLNGTKL